MSEGADLCSVGGNQKHDALSPLKPIQLSNNF